MCDHQTCSRYTDICMYVYSHVHTYVYVYIFTYIRESLQIWTHIVCALIGCVVLFSTFKNEDRQFRQKCCTLFRTYKQTYIQNKCG